MANNDLVPKKSIALDLDTYARLSKLAGQLQAAKPGGGFVSMSAAVAVLLDGFEIMKRGYELHDELAMKDFNEFGRKHFAPRVQHPIPLVSLRDYIANAEANDPRYLDDSQNETK